MRFLYMMTTNDLYQQIHRNKPLMQRLARKLVKDFDTSRFLYNETAHRALQQRENLNKETMEEWLKHTMKNIYQNLRKGQVQNSYL